MADTITSSKTLAVGLEYEESGTTKTATVKIPNYRANVTEAQIKAAFNNSILIYGYDEEGTPQYFNSDSVLTASTTNQTINNLEINWEG